jgi:hypothetical protein
MKLKGLLVSLTDVACVYMSSWRAAPSLRTKHNPPAGPREPVVRLTDTTRLILLSLLMKKSAPHIAISILEQTFLFNVVVG